MKSHTFARLLALWFCQIASAQSATLAGSWTESLTVPDHDDLGISVTHDLSASASDTITGLSVSLQFTGGWNGDLYVYLYHEGAISLLLNRVGSSAIHPEGFGSSGMDVTLVDSALSDIHLALASSGVATGTFQPDGRQADPLSVLDTDPRTAPLSVFNGLSAAGDWTLFVADQSSGGVSQLTSWSLELETVPEPMALSSCAVSLLYFAGRRRRK